MPNMTKFKEDSVEMVTRCLSCTLPQEKCFGAAACADGKKYPRKGKIGLVVKMLKMRLPRTTIRSVLKISSHTMCQMIYRAVKLGYITKEEADASRDDARRHHV